MSNKIYVVTAFHYTEWTGPDENGEFDVCSDSSNSNIDSFIIGAYSDRERAIAVSKSYVLNHEVKNPEECRRCDLGPIDHVSVHSILIDDEADASATKYEFSV